ncbi:acyl-CoA dehydrogenase family protein [Frankia sp. QA3]|uniref:acyl-CoA dehydrogenase family protein n=1 Tax=Frankia sp. QA3 TaxID=710111 RepID=UPI000269C3B2|nr:acyl-CoA dehydrogenase family protein [Frankia sp. QA3]EIV94748.1 acyl-CoA dehydrogenase [Frankia sp. QA3]
MSAETADALAAAGASQDDDRARVERAAREVLAGIDPATATTAEFLGACYDAGLAWVHFPVGFGGLGVPAGLQAVADAILAAGGRPDPFLNNPIGVGMAGPTLHGHADEQLRARLLRPLYTGENMWAQLFSEPGAGSDLAGLSTRAVRDGDGWVVDGQKVWTSLAHLASWALLLARTDPDLPKHRGLTYFIVDMHAPGVEVRPLRQATGQAEFNEVYLTGVRVPDAHRLGDVGQGWNVAMTTLMNERSAIGDSALDRGSGTIADALGLWRDRPDLHTPALRLRLAGLWTQAEAHRLTGERARVARTAGPPGPEASIGKLVGAELNQKIYDFCMDMLGPEGTLYDSYDDPADSLQRRFLRARANTIEGGTSQILRNVLGERVLRLPGDVRVDTGKPWRDVPRG